MTDHLRDRIAAALYERERPPRDPHWPDAYAMDREVFEAMADAVLPAVQPELDALAALRAVARGYCPACGRGDAAPGVEDWEQQKRRADEAEAKVADYENRITWHTTCGSCARTLDSGIRETERAERAEAAIREIDPTAEIDHWQCRVLPYEYEKWREAAAGATQAADGRKEPS
jgi:hypothetical protein